MDHSSELDGRQRKHEEASPRGSPRVELRDNAPTLASPVADISDVIEDHVEDEGSRRAKKRHKVNHGKCSRFDFGNLATNACTLSLCLLPSFGERPPS